MLKINDYYKTLGLDMDSSIEEIQESFERKMYELDQKQAGITDESLLFQYKKEYKRLLDAHRVLVSAKRQEYDRLYGKIEEKNEQARVDYVVNQIFGTINQGEQYVQSDKAKHMFTMLGEFVDGVYNTDTEEIDNLAKDIDFSTRTGRVEIPSTNDHSKNIMNVTSNFDEEFEQGRPLGEICSVSSTKKNTENKVGEKVKPESDKLKEADKAEKNLGKDNNNENYFTVLFNELFRKAKNSTIIDNLRIRKGDTAKSYFIRNKNILAILIASGVLAGTLTMCSKKDDDLVLFEDKSTIQNEISDDENNFVVTPTISSEVEDKPLLLKRLHKIDYGDTLAGYSMECNSTIAEIKRINFMDSDNIIVGNNIILPYYVDKSDLDLYKTKAVYDDSMAVQDYAKLFNTDLETFLLINGDTIKHENGRYIVSTDEVYVPNFISKKEYEELKAGQRVSNYQKALQ